jgi:hypothetical protein
MLFTELPRTSGKTKSAIEWYLHDPLHRGIVVINEQERKRVLGLIRRQRPLQVGLLSSVITFNNLVQGRMRGTHREWMIDNLDIALGELGVTWVTVTSE